MAFTDGAVLVHLATMAPTAVNRTAYAAWLACAGGADRLEITGMLAATFAMMTSDIDDDVERILDHLLRSDLLEPDHPSEPSGASERPAPQSPPQPARGGCAPDDPGVRTPEAHGDHWHLPIEPSPCQKLIDELPWAEKVALRIGRFHVGVRCDSVDTAVVLRHLLPTLVVDDPDAPAIYSLVLQSPAARLSTDVARSFVRRGLYEGRTWLTGSEAPARVISCLLTRLDGLTPAPEGVVRLTGLAVHDGLSAAVIPMHRGAQSPARHAWERKGLRVLEAPITCTVDDSIGPGAATVTGGWPGIAADPAVVAKLGLADPTAARRITAQTIGRYSAAPPLRSPTVIRVVVFDHVPNTMSERCAALVPFVHLAPDDDPRNALDRAAQLVRSTEFQAVEMADLTDGVPAILPTHR